MLFPSFDEFGACYNPVKQVDFASDIRKTIMGDYSTLDMLNMAFGKNSSTEWLTAHLAELNTFTGSKNMDDGQTLCLAKIIAQEYKDVKFSVLMLFFYKFKCGHFGKFYGKVDPMVITCALRDFIAECDARRQEFVNEDHALKRQEEEARRARWLKAEHQWWRCQKALAQRCSDKEGKDMFLRMELESCDHDKRVLTFGVSREDYDVIEGVCFPLFSQGMKEYFPGFSVQYHIAPPSVDEERNPVVRRERSLRQRETETGLASAEKILSNALGLEKEQLEQLRYSFRLRYKHSPEDYLNLFRKG